MRVSDLQIKDVVCTTNGKKLGKIIDIDMQENGVINYFVVEERHFFNLFKNREEININISQIKKIGEDVILVEI